MPPWIESEFSALQLCEHNDRQSRCSPYIAYAWIINRENPLIAIVVNECRRVFLFQKYKFSSKSTCQGLNDHLERRFIYISCEQPMQNYALQKSTYKPRHHRVFSKSKSNSLIKFKSMHFSYAFGSLRKIAKTLTFSLVQCQSKEKMKYLNLNI